MNKDLELASISQEDFNYLMIRALCNLYDVSDGANLKIQRELRNIKSLFDKYIEQRDHKDEQT